MRSPRRRRLRDQHVRKRLDVLSRYDPDGVAQGVITSGSLNKTTIGRYLGGHKGRHHGKVLDWLEEEEGGDDAGTLEEDEPWH